MKVNTNVRRFVTALVLFTALATVAGAADEGIVRMHLLWTNDIHGHVAPEPARFMNPSFPPPLGGGASMMNYVEEVRAMAAAAGEEVLLLDAGDTFQGAPVGSKTKGDAVVEFFNTIGYDAIVPGNHDFDMGRENCERLAKNCNMPWICANLRDESTGELVDWVIPTTTFHKGGLKIGLIGIVTPATVHMSFPDNIRGLIFDPMAPAIERWRDELRAQGCDMVGLLIHEGLPFDPDAGWKEIINSQVENDDRETDAGGYGYVRSGNMNLMELMHEVSGIDFAVGGHTHRGYQEPWIDPVTHTICLESYGNGSSVGHVIFNIDAASGSIVSWDAPHDRGTLITLFEDEYWPHQTMADALEPYIEMTEAEMGRIIGQSKVNLNRGGPGANIVGNLVTDAMRLYFEADFSFQNLGGLRANVPAGDITARDVFSILPFGNELVVVDMDGAMIRRIVERKVRGKSGGICISGAQVRFNKSRPDMNRVCSFLIGGEPLDPKKIYKVVATSFLMEGNSGLDFLTGIASNKIELTQITTAETVEAFVAANSPIRPRIDDRWVEDPSAVQNPYLEAPFLP